MTEPAFPPMPALEPGFEILDAEARDGVLVRDVRIEDPGGGAQIEAYLVEPEIVDARETRRPGLLFAHWFDTEAPNGNRTEFVDEAVEWARRHAAAAILPQLTFPWAGDPTGAAADSERIVAEVGRLRRCLDVVTARPAVDASRLGVVGHDFGGMHAIILATVDRRPAAYVLIAAVPRWGDWFLPFWPIEEDRIDYLRGIRPLDPIEHVRGVAPGRVLFQFGLRDFFIAPMTGREFARAAGDNAEYAAYPDAEHDMTGEEIAAARTAFLESALRS
jgi:pimeloyl-ACP methyl ester carboxylesterase